MHASNEIEVPEPARQARAGDAQRATAARVRGRAGGMGRWRRAGLALAMLAGAGTLVAACGGGSGSSSVSGSGSSGSPGSNPAQFAQCMRGHGEPSFPDPNTSGKFSLQITQGGPLQPNSATFKSALQACRKYDTSFGSSPGGGSSSGAGALKFSECMRSHGVTDFPDPQSSGGFFINGSIHSNPHFQSAMQACRHFLSGGGS